MHTNKAYQRSHTTKTCLQTIQQTYQTTVYVQSQMAPMPILIAGCPALPPPNDPWSAFREFCRRLANSSQTRQNHDQQIDVSAVKVSVSCSTTNQPLFYWPNTPSRAWRSAADVRKELLRSAKYQRAGVVSGSPGLELSKGEVVQCYNGWYTHKSTEPWIYSLFCWVGD